MNSDHGCRCSSTLLSKALPVIAHVPRVDEKESTMWCAMQKESEGERNTETKLTRKRKKDNKR